MKAPKDPRFALLTGPALQLAEKAGFDAAVRLMVALGGQRLYVPRKMRPGSPFYEPLGRDAARALAELFGGEHIEVPLGTGLKESQIRAQIAAFKGTNNKAVETFGRHRRTIQRIRHGQQDTRQQSLFETPSKS